MLNFWWEQIGKTESVEETAWWQTGCCEVWKVDKWSALNLLSCMLKEALIFSALSPPCRRAMGVVNTGHSPDEFSYELPSEKRSSCWRASRSSSDLILRHSEVQANCPPRLCQRLFVLYLNCSGLAALWPYKHFIKHCCSQDALYYCIMPELFFLLMVYVKKWQILGHCGNSQNKSENVLLMLCKRYFWIRGPN